MPAGKHLRGVSKKEQRQYEHIKASAQESGKYGKRVEEISCQNCNETSRRRRSQDWPVISFKSLTVFCWVIVLGFLQLIS